jgi:hypothetical protein
MRWRDDGSSADIEDRRGQSAGGFRGLPGGGRLGLGGVLLLLLLSVIMKQDLFQLLDTGSGPAGVGAPAASRDARPSSPEEERLVRFVSFVIGDVQDAWTREFKELAQEYSRAKLVLFTDATRSGCGFAESAMGPFYCPADAKVYIDLGFYRELKQRFGAPGDFAQAYVIAHEVGHHVQSLLGTEAKMRAAQRRMPGRANELSVRLELQADCYAGVWGHSTEQRKLLEAGDVEEGLGAAAAVGDDRIQRQTGGGVNPETWTHGSSKQRVEWFRRGFASGRVQDCDTFAR